MWGSAFEVVTSHCPRRGCKGCQITQAGTTCRHMSRRSCIKASKLRSSLKSKFSKVSSQCNAYEVHVQGAGGEEEGLCKVGRLPLGGYSIRGKRDCEASLPIRPFHNLPVGTARLRTRRFGNIFNFDEPSSPRPTTAFDEFLPGFFIKRRTGGH